MANTIYYDKLNRRIEPGMYLVLPVMWCGTSADTKIGKVLYTTPKGIRVSSYADGKRIESTFHKTERTVIIPEESLPDNILAALNP